MTTTQITSSNSIDTDLLKRLAGTVRGLSIDGVEAAKSGHPGLPLGCADLAVTLWYHFLRYNPADPKWPGRDKFILSAGHGSMLIYSLLHLAGFDLSLDELKNFRQWESKTPGHPENFITPGVETTTGPLGQGFAVGVGFAMADRMLAARVNRDGFAPVDSFVYAIVSDGDLMEGVALEAASFAGFNKLGNLIYLYDDNDISLDGPTSLTFVEDTEAKFIALGWHVQKVDGFDHKAIAEAILKAQKVTDKPSLIICKTIIGFGSPNKAGTSGVHGSPLGKDEAALTKKQLGLSEEPFHVPAADREAWEKRRRDNLAAYEAWQASLAAAKSKHPDAVATFEAHFALAIPTDLITKIPTFDPTKPIATRKASEAALKALGPHVPWLVGGSADLSGSTNAIIAGGGDVTPENLTGRHLYFGVREHAMGAICNGMTTQGAFRAYGGTFLTFSDYMRGAVRLGALSHCASIWVWTHDSIFLGEDGPTHQPVEHVAALRAIPNLVVLRPGDAVETAEAWVAALEQTDRPSALILTRQNVPVFDRSTGEFAPVGGVAKGGYVFRKEKYSGPLDGILIATGSELSLAVEAARQLEASGKSVRVVSLPSWELFDEQPASYREEVLPSACRKRLAIEAGISMGWAKYVGDFGGTVTQDTFGASAPASVLAEKFGFTTKNVIERFIQLG